MAPSKRHPGSACLSLCRTTCAEKDKPIDDGTVVVRLDEGHDRSRRHRGRGRRCHDRRAVGHRLKRWQSEPLTHRHIDESLTLRQESSQHPIAHLTEQVDPA